MATAKQKAAARRNIKKAQRARWSHKPHKTGRDPGVLLDKIHTLI